MRIITAGQGRTGTPFHRAALRVCCVLAALLLVLSSAAAETAPSWEERMAAAREKYNEKTVNVYVRGKGWKRSGKINVCFYRSKKKQSMSINIRESLQISDQYEMQAVLEKIMENENYDEAVYGSIAFMKAQWITHNVAHGMATGDSKQLRKWVETIAGEKLSRVIKRAKELDLSPIERIPEQEMRIYRLVELALVN